MNIDKNQLIIGLIIFGLAFTGSVLFISRFSNSPIVEVNGNSAEGVTYYLGDRIYNDPQHDFYFHGIVYRLSINNEFLVIGHHGYSAMSNMEFYIKIGSTFRIMDQSFKVLDFGYSWITLERV